jgi:hypothetical protein
MQLCLPDQDFRPRCAVAPLRRFVPLSSVCVRQPGQSVGKMWATPLLLLRAQHASRPVGIVLMTRLIPSGDRRRTAVLGVSVLRHLEAREKCRSALARLASPAAYGSGILCATT